MMANYPLEYLAGRADGLAGTVKDRTAADCREIGEVMQQLVAMGRELHKLKRMIRFAELEHAGIFARVQQEDGTAVVVDGPNWDGHDLQAELDAATS